MITEFKKEPENKPELKKVVKSNPKVDFKVRLPFNGYKRGEVVKGVEKTKALIWEKKERGNIL